MKKSVRFSRAGVYLKLSLVQVAHAAVKNKKKLKSNLLFQMERENVLDVVKL